LQSYHFAEGRTATENSGWQSRTRPTQILRRRTTAIKLTITRIPRFDLIDILQYGPFFAEERQFRHFRALVVPLTNALAVTPSDLVCDVVICLP